MTDSCLTLFCLVDGASTFNAFCIKISSNDTVHDLKKLIKTENTNDFSDIDASKLTLWRVSIPITDDDDEIPIMLNNVNSNKKRLHPAICLLKVFPEGLPEETVHIIIQRPPQAPKSDCEEDEGPSSKRKRLDTYTLREATQAAGLTEKVVVDGRYDISLLKLPSNYKVPT
ncbi:hypothetical protein BG003_011801 [Podila horticola]|nr:hypothetical protein BG003_011801 [Podila horticola]